MLFDEFYLAYQFQHILIRNIIKLFILLYWKLSTFNIDEISIYCQNDWFIQLRHMTSSSLLSSVIPDSCILWTIIWLSRSNRFIRFFIKLAFNFSARIAFLKYLNSSSNPRQLLGSPISLMHFGQKGFWFFTSNEFFQLDRQSVQIWY